ncbi:P-loop containing nucleoside triphosphate hydrolase protein [Cucurbitaria berberidis CBS 394.84]|uniref:Ribosome-releasing factor 2, mitochondrial n=1 Tax=Cucurbitaria berberidis CBS 394.84 TaxID=1168544 RepID=A0A9P4LAG5_9PLEO|nr:P-loop containing nucleoside triphosphate hydrolase protein [Cucurbitaria berberidis CBS 394.84]KAF1847463.1 P-loop containing nucleoside triphosphate hydrolase protein [Cucurbitaria berberidis CBS 394.84]
MWVGWVWCARRAVRHNVKPPRRLLSVQAQPQADLLSKATRNIGIIAHIDAGKTTTTERMLYYSGYTRRIGDVDEGSTVTDFLPAERARGITIQSAAITFHWPPLPPNAQTPPQTPQLPSSFDTSLRSSIPHNINLIDTPGHADFTFEVLRSLRVLDGAVCILDGVAGVEAQTEKVWTQAGLYHIPRIIFVNKLDRVGAAFSSTVKEIGVRLHGWPAVCQIPWWQGGNGEFVGVGDAVNLRGLLWRAGGDGRDIQAFDLAALSKTDQKFAEEIKKARIALVEILSEHDDGMVEYFLEYDEDHLAIPGIQVMQSLRRVVLQAPQVIIPVFAGASFRNIGAQPLLDAVVDLLPSPFERPDPEISISNRSSTLSALVNSAATAKPVKPSRKQQQPKTEQLAIAEVKNLTACALAFKVVNDPKRGVLVYVRVYSGSIDRGATLYNTNLAVAERVPRLLKMYANDAVEVDSITAGQIGVITGLKHARTGDTLIVYRGLQMKGTPSGGLNTLQLRPINVPPPVFFTSIEPHSLSEQKHVQESLGILLREDPSLHLSIDEESGQTHLAGMGDLHLEIARDRLLNDFKAKARIGKIEIGYRETINTPTSPYTHILDKPIAGKQAKASVTASVEPADDSAISVGLQEEEEHIEDGAFETTYKLPDNNTLHISHPNLSRHDSASHKHHLPPQLSLPGVLHSIQAGASAALARGPFNGYPVANTRVNVDLNAQTHLLPETTPTAISMATRAAVGSSLRSANDTAPSALLEPVMMATIFVNEGSLGAVVQDISSSRGGQVLSLDGSNSPTSSNSDDDMPHIDPNLIYTPPDPFASGTGEVGSGLANSQRQIVARVPLKEMVGYLNHLRALTGGRGTFVMTVDGFEKMGSQRQKEVLDAMRDF